MSDPTQGADPAAPAPRPARGSARPGASRRKLLMQAGSLVLLLGAQQIARGAGIVAVRVWPAQDYSRVTIESDQKLSAKQFFVATPPRLAVDIEGIDLNPELRELVAKVKADDPNIAGIRVGQNAPGVVRLVIDLKRAALPQVFSLAPVAAYRHRLVFDLYPAVAEDPLEALIAERLRESPAPTPLPHIAAKPGTPADPLGDLIAQHGQRADPPAPGIAPAAPPLASAAPAQPRPRPPARSSRNRSLPRPRPSPAPPTVSSSWRWIPATAAKTPAPSARPARARRTWC